MKKRVAIIFLGILVALTTIMPGTSVQAKGGFSLKKLEGKGFTFASGAGAWDTSIIVKKNGKFEGMYHDTDMGDVGKGYPYGSMYVCEFTGKFKNLKKINKYTYSVKFTKLKKVYKNKTVIKDKIRYIYTDPYGFESGKKFYIYLPGAPVKKLHESFCQWTFMTNGFKGKKLDFYGLYNVKKQYGFFSESVKKTKK